MRKLREYWLKLVEFVELWPEVYSVAILIAAWYFSSRILDLLDPMAGAFKLGEIHRVLFSVVVVAILSGFAFLGIKLNYPGLYKYYAQEFKHDFKELSAWQRVKVFSAYYLLLLSLLVLCAWIL